MSSALERLDRNYENLKANMGVVDTRYYVGEIKESTPEQFAEEANLVMEAYIAGKVKPVSFCDSSH